VSGRRRAGMIADSHGEGGPPAHHHFGEGLLPELTDDLRPASGVLREHLPRLRIIEETIASLPYDRVCRARACSAT
jgi:hypothetical protein